MPYRQKKWTKAENETQHSFGMYFNNNYTLNENKYSQPYKIFYIYKRYDEDICEDGLEIGIHFIPCKEFC